MRCASHEHVVDLIRSSGSLVTMTVVSQTFPNNFQQQQQQVNLHNNNLFILNVQSNLEIYTVFSLNPISNNYR